VVDKAAADVSSAAERSAKKKQATQRECRVKRQGGCAVVVALRWTLCLAAQAIRGCMNTVMREAAVAAPAPSSHFAHHLKEKRRPRRFSRSLGACGGSVGWPGR
jgi:hypothetical protein